MHFTEMVILKKSPEYSFALIAHLCMLGHLEIAFVNAIFNTFATVVVCLSFLKS